MKIEQGRKRLNECKENIGEKSSLLFRLQSLQTALRQYSSVSYSNRAIN